MYSNMSLENMLKSALRYSPKKHLVYIYSFIFETLPYIEENIKTKKKIRIILIQPSLLTSLIPYWKYNPKLKSLILGMCSIETAIT